MNDDTTVLNGPFSIQEYVDVSLQVSYISDAFLVLGGLTRVYRPTQSFTITNVTLKNGTNYAVEFVNPANHSDVYATGPKFEVKPSGSKFFRGSFSSSRD